MFLKLQKILLYVIVTIKNQIIGIISAVTKG
jgi:hypothetical protein